MLLRSLLLVGAVAPSLGLLLPSATCHRPVATRRAHVFAGLDETPMIDGQPVKIGDSVVCRDETSDAWWRASVRDIRGSDVLITFMGCDNAWDTCA